jgi:ethanolamine utilization protein EutP (predicted NTPase)
LLLPLLLKETDWEAFVKTYAHAALIVFLIVLGVKMYSLSVRNSLQSQITQSREPIIENSDVVAVLSKLGEVEGAEEMSIERTFASLNETGEEDITIKLNQLDQLALELEQAYLESGDNFEMITHLKREISIIKEKESLELRNVEEWGIEMVYFLIIEERMTLEEINMMNDPSDLNMNDREWDTLITQSQSPTFKRKIMEYKNVELKNPLDSLTTGIGQEELIEEIWGESEQ